MSVLTFEFQFWIYSCSFNVESQLVSRLRRQIWFFESAAPNLNFLILVKSSRSFQIFCRTLFNRFWNRSHKLTFLDGYWGFCGPSELCAGTLSFLWAHWAFCGPKHTYFFVSRLRRQIWFASRLQILLFSRLRRQISFSFSPAAPNLIFCFACGAKSHFVFSPAASNPIFFSPAAPNLIFV